MLEKRKKEQKIVFWIEREKACRLERAYGVADPFLGAFYGQCTESTAADAYEVFLETPLAYNYFRENLDRLSEEGVKRFFRLAAIHHTIRVVRRRKKELNWSIKERKRNDGTDFRKRNKRNMGGNSFVSIP